jgi:hypothetical protein
MDGCSGAILEAPPGVEFRVVGYLEDFLAKEERAPMARASSLAQTAALAAASDGTRMMTAKEAAAWLRKSRSWAYRHADELRARRVGAGRGADLLFRQSDLEAWLEKASQGIRQ